MTTETTEKFEAWAIVELMGHRVIAGRVIEEAHFGTNLLRIDVPESDGVPAFSQYYGGNSIYCLTPCDEAVARAAIQRHRPQPPIVLRPMLAPPVPGEKRVETWRPEEEGPGYFDDDDDDDWDGDPNEDLPPDDYADDDDDGADDFPEFRPPSNDPDHIPF